MVHFMSQRMNGKPDRSVLGTNQLKLLYKAYKRLAQYFCFLEKMKNKVINGNT